jgi:hypothetical protein
MNGKRRCPCYYPARYIPKEASKKGPMGSSGDGGQVGTRGEGVCGEEGGEKGVRMTTRTHNRYDNCSSHWLGTDVVISVNSAKVRPLILKHP